MSRDARGRFVSERPCLIERVIGGYWCRVHRRWADDGHIRAARAVLDAKGTGR